jgi:2-polyprenyl-3-methyl-5-hydroxy-6-metoxy-1,4-benzoquinol methylase/glycosyltransferase involved in cell wall biosynthesis
MNIANIVNGHAERFVPAIKEFGIKTVYEHIHRYAYTSRFVNGKRVLDLGCGEGYGGWILSENASEVVGIDKDAQVIQHAQAIYKKDNLRFTVSNVDRLPFDSGEFDVVVCFEIIEHIITQEELMAEIKRVLRDNGVLFISTPIKKNGYTKPHHLKELTLHEFEELIYKNFKNVKFMEQKVYLSSNIWSVSDISGSPECLRLFFEENDFIKIVTETKNRKPEYLLAIASNSDITFLTNSILMDSVGDKVDKLCEKLHEKERALECASRIFKKKHEVNSRHLKKLLALETTVADLKNKLTDKDEILQKVLSHFYRIIPIDIKTRPSVITDKISVIIPVKNGGEQLRGLLQKIRAQRKVQNVEIIIIDSESTDNSVEIAMEYGAKIIKISQKEFNHGATRNLGAKEAKGDYLVFTVQDAMPNNDYWLYNMICPFLEYPELAAISSRQFVKPEADLFSIWMNESLIKSFGLEGDTIYSLSDATKEIRLEFFDSSTKRRLTFFDNVSSCIKRSVFGEIQFTPLINAEDIDYGVRLIERKKTLGYLTSTGVYHWHERGADYVFKRHYIGTKANVYVLKNELQYFFDINNIDWQYLAANLLGIYELISISISEIGEVSPEPIKAVQSFINALQKNMDTLPDKAEKTSKLDSRLHGNDGLEAFSGEDGGLGLLLREIVDGDAIFILKQKYNFKQNFLISDFMKHLENLTAYLCSKQHTLNGREKDFISCLYKIFAVTAGDALGAYYLEAETLNRLTPELKRIDRLLGKGVCYF